MFLFSFWSCKDDEKEISIIEEIQTRNTPRCIFEDTETDTKNAYLINSIEDLPLCSKDDFSMINFNNHSLVIARGSTTKGVKSITKNIIQTASNTYKLNITVKLDMTDVAEGWLVVLLTEKIPEGATIQLDMNEVL